MKYVARLFVTSITMAAVATAAIHLVIASFANDQMPWPFVALAIFPLAALNACRIVAVGFLRDCDGMGVSHG